MAKNNETNDYSVEELMAMIKAKTTEEERKKITKELTKKEPVVEYYKHEKHHNYYVEEEKDEDGNILIEGEKFYKLTDLDEFKKVVKRDLDKYLARMFYDEEYNYFKGFKANLIADEDYTKDKEEKFIKPFLPILINAFRVEDLYLNKI